MDLAIILSTLDATIRLSTPLLLACLAGLYSERAGVFDIGLEGKMLAAAFGAAAVAAVTNNVWLGLMAGLAVSIGTSALQGAAAITLKGNQLIADARRSSPATAASATSRCPLPASCRTCRSSARSIPS
jgi:simple sugar transport system permease protein